MDIIAHGLLANLVFQEVPWPNRAWGIFFSLAPDLLSLFPVYNLSFVRYALFFKKAPQTAFPKITFDIYKITHSLLIWLALYLIFYIVGWRELAMLWWGWALHIVVDIFTHSSKAFPTKFLWPVSDFYFNGLTWSNKWFMLFCYVLLLVLYLVAY